MKKVRADYLFDKELDDLTKDYASEEEFEIKEEDVDNVDEEVTRWTRKELLGQFENNEFKDLTKDSFFGNVDAEEDYYSNHTSQDGDDVHTMDHIVDHEGFADNKDFVMGSSNLHEIEDHEDEEPFLPPQAPESMLTIGMEWPNISECRSFMRNFAITQRFTFRQKKNKSRMIRYVCKERPSCPWWVFITKLNYGHTMTLKRGHFIHECSGKNIWVAKEIENLIKDTSTTKPILISDIVYRRFGIRDKLLSKMVERLNLIQMTLMYERKLKAREWDQNGLVPRAVKMIELLKTYSHYYSHYHRVAAYVATYNQAVNPITDSSEWGEYTFTLMKQPTREIRPPPLLRPAGRPRILRRREADEVNGMVRQPRRCSKCQIFRHNNRTCKG
ncbi:hypothetical protein GIB67_026070 [Kingdonia uniflora]|uniref:Transposase MuDR plant domain-containing protein n=1 Tax=Kingdonia uniflora TaxID=39325 RepID=A0A7J7M361_9MAGN|nr:hypothetical protein GIB67_026070 [Kingdonia uniflora]